MARITALEPVDGRKQRLRVEVDEAPQGELPASLVEELGLAQDTEWTDALAERFAEAQARDAALQEGAQRLNRQAMSRARLVEALEGAGHAAEAARWAADRLETVHAIDEDTLGRALIARAERAEVAGPLLLQQKLEQAGLPQERIERLIAERWPTTQEVRAAAASLAQQRWRHETRGARRRRLQRVARALGRRGFDEETVEEVMRAWEEEADEEEA